MARRRAGKAKPRSAAPRAGGRRRKTTKGAVSEAQPAAPGATLSERLAALERERDALRAELELERARRRALEDVYAATRDRISWALDSLQTILDAKN
jgi:hypothetical protein